MLVSVRGVLLRIPLEPHNDSLPLVEGVQDTLRPWYIVGMTESSSTRIGQFDLEDTLEVLARTPKVLDALLRGTSASWHAIDEGEDTWSAIDIVGHLVHGEETDWVTRARIILKHGAERPFEPFDRFAQQRRFADWTLERLLDRFAALRRSSLDTVRSWQLTEAQLALPGRHPELGAVNLGQLLAAWAVHDLGHIAQIARVMAKRHGDDVGAWQAYLPILHR